MPFQATIPSRPRPGESGPDRAERGVEVAPVGGDVPVVFTFGLMLGQETPAVLDAA
jgi:hypothetical protein